jgi:two-component system, response regulator PdtaR
VYVGVHMTGRANPIGCNVAPGSIRMQAVCQLAAILLASSLHAVFLTPLNPDLSPCGALSPMTSALTLGADTQAGRTRENDLEAAGIHVIGATSRHTLVRDAARLAPDVVILWDDDPDESLFEALGTLGRVAPCPVVLFTEHGDADRIAQGIRAGVHAYVVSGYGPQRLRPLIQAAQARFLAEHSLRNELAAISSRLEERTLVDRAKGILMKAGGLSEDEAFRILRSASQRNQRRVGQVSRRLIDAARVAEAVNRAGQLRMLSQRIVKLQALRLAGIEVSDATGVLEESSIRVRSNLQVLQELLPGATQGHLLRQAGQTWARIDSALCAPATPESLAELDRLAEVLLEQADRLVEAVGGADPTGGLRVVNLCGRQRMLSQRLAKQVLLAGLIDAPQAAVSAQGASATAAEFDRALHSLRQAGGDQESRARLDDATRCWLELRESLPTAASDEGRLAVAAASEALLEILEQLTDRFEHSLTVLLG